MTPRTKQALMLVVAFGLGGVAGAFGMRAVKLDQLNHLMAGPPQEARRRFMLEMLTQRLELTPAQVPQVTEVLERHDKARREAFERCRPEHEAVRAQSAKDIDELLTPAQRALHEELRRELEARRKEGGPPR